MSTSMELENKKGLDVELKERLKQLPKPVQRAIQSAELEKNLRGLSDKHRLHLDQWQLLENEVMLALLGFQPAENLESNIRKEVGVEAGVARALTEDISKTVFEPIRQELERELEHPEAKEKEETDVERARREALRDSAEAEAPINTPQTAPTPVQPAATSMSAENTPPAPRPAPSADPAQAQPAPQQPANPKPEQKITRPSDSTAYKPGEASSNRRSVEDDPYRELPL